MGRTTQRLIQVANRFFAARDEYFGMLARSEMEAFEYSVRAGQVVHDQFHGFNDFSDCVVLDFGCGRGGKTVYYAARGARRTIGVDVSDNWTTAGEYARQRGLAVDFAAPAADGGIPLPDQSCDVIINSSVLEHVADLPRTLAELRRVLRPDGRLLNRWHPFRSRYGAHIWSAIGVPFAHLIFNEADLVRVFCQTLVQRHQKLPPTMQAGFEHSATLDKLHFHLNRKTIREMHAALGQAGFDIRARRFYRGTRPVRLAARLPERWVDYFIDYEVQVCTPQRQ